MRGLPVTLCLVLITIGMVNYAQGLHCYECTSTSDGDCGDPFDTSKFDTTDCLLAQACAKMEVLSTVTRSCLSTCVELDGLHCCTTDGCNSGSTAVVSFFLMFVLLAAGLYYARN